MSSFGKGISMQKCYLIYLVYALDVVCLYVREWKHSLYSFSYSVCIGFLYYIKKENGLYITVYVPGFFFEFGRKL